MKATPVKVQEYLALLGETTRRIESITKYIDNSRLQARPNKEDWSANDILAHLRSCADVWGKSIEKMIAKDKQTLPYVHPLQWIEKTDYPELPFRESFQTFKSQRRKLLGALKKLPFEDWSRGATIKGREHTIFSQVRRMARHESEHCKEIDKLLKSS
jgi:uncharacterized damage-inducible protein DinB